MSKKRKVIVFEVTPEMKMKKQALNKLVIKEMKKTNDIAALSKEMQNASMLSAIESGY